MNSPIDQDPPEKAESQLVSIQREYSRMTKPSNWDELPVIELEHLDCLWFQVAGTRCNLECNHCFISCSPKNKSFGFLSLAEVKKRLGESLQHGVKEYYFTGGEPFLNPDMTDILCETLKFGPATVLTNGTVFKSAWLDRLKEAVCLSRFSLEFRVSIDGFSAESNDPIRGEGTFDRAIGGIQTLVEYGFMPIITAARTWEISEDVEVIGKFVELLKSKGYSRPRLKILPTLQMGAEEDRTTGYRETERVTQEMLVDYDSSQLVCSNSRIVTDRGIHVCPILIESPDSLMSQSIEDSKTGYAITHGGCYTCYQYGAICSNNSAAKSATQNS